MKFRPAAMVALLAATLASVRADTVAVAAAANLTYVLTALNTRFQQENPGATVTVTLSSSGNLYAQITNGAPFDVFLSADMDFARRLADSGFGEPATLRPFATGRLALWTLRPDLPLSDIAAVVRSPLVKRLAMAEPRTAPFGTAAKATLNKLGLLAVATPKLVIGENIAQTAQFVQTGNADAGFVALSFVLSPRLAHRGHWVAVPEALYAPVSLEQGAILTRHGARNAAARRYLEFLHTDAARKILEAAGYGVPSAAAGSSARR